MRVSHIAVTRSPEVRPRCEFRSATARVERARPGGTGAPRTSITTLLLRIRKNSNVRGTRPGRPGRPLRVSHIAATRAPEVHGRCEPRRSAPCASSELVPAAPRRRGSPIAAELGVTPTRICFVAGLRELAAFWPLGQDFEHWGVPWQLAKVRPATSTAERAFPGAVKLNHARKRPVATSSSRLAR